MTDEMYRSGPTNADFDHTTGQYHCGSMVPVYDKGVLTACCKNMALLNSEKADDSASSQLIPTNVTTV